MSGISLARMRKLVQPNSRVRRLFSFVCERDKLVSRISIRQGNVGLMVMGGAYDGVVVCKFIVDRHVFEEPAHVVIEKSLYYFEIKLRVNEHGTDTGFDGVRKRLGGILVQSVIDYPSQK